jgi:AraC-like DNA-binding protein
MSENRQPPIHAAKEGEHPIAIRSFAVRHEADCKVPPHHHNVHQLIYASQGIMWVHTADGDWVIPPTRAVWVPAGVKHSIDLVAPIQVQTLYLAVDLSAEFPSRCCAVNVSPLLRELIVHIVALGKLDRAMPTHQRLIAFLLDQVLALPAAPLQIPLPSDARARQAANWLQTHPDDPGLIKQMADRVAVSPRTLERIFQRETGLSFGRWRQQLRLLQAMRLLAGGKGVTTVAVKVGYDSPSAFIAAFKRFFGTTPARFFD